jgi:signal transduction histidine kinase/CheY-like chemotaxis protein
VLLACIGLAVGYGALASRNAQSLARDRAKDIAVVITTRLADSLRYRVDDVCFLAGAVGRDPSAGHVRPMMDDIQSRRPEFAWIGVAGADGVVFAASGRLLEGVDVSARPWFQRGRSGRAVLDVHEAILLARQLPKPSDGSPLRFLDVVCPVPGGTAVLAGHLHVEWARRAIQETAGPAIARLGARVIVHATNGDEVVAMGAMPANLPDDALIAADSRMVSDGDVGLGWRVVVQVQPSAVWHEVETWRTNIVIGGLVAAILTFAGTLLIARRLTLPLRRLAREASAARVPHDIASADGPGEVREIASAFRTLLANLGQERVGLEREVARRTRDLERARERAEQVSASKSSILAMASHDLRQPLHGALLLLSALRRRLRGSEEAEIAARIEAAMLSMQTMFTGILDLSRIEAGVLVSQPADIAIGPLIDAIGAEFRAAAEAKRLTLRVLPTSLHARADPELLAMVTRNLVSNAVKFTDGGRIIVGCRRSGRRFVELVVADSGPGIAIDRQADIFEPYERAGASRAAGHDGLGLGLAIVRRLAGIMGGEVRVRSRPGHGAVFAVRLPAAERAAASNGRRTGPIAAAAERPSMALVIDDDPLVRDAVALVLGDRHLDVRTAGSCAEAVALVEGGVHPDLMVVDYDLGDGPNGLDTVGRIEARLGSVARVVIVTGASDAATLARLQQSGLEWLVKPVDPPVLLAAAGLDPEHADALGPGDA